MRIWSFSQLIVLLLLLSYLFSNLAAIGAPGIFYYGGFVFLTVFAYTELMDRNPQAWLWELGKNLLGFYLLLTFPGWFGLAAKLPGIELAIGGYLISASVVTVWMNRQQRDDSKTVLAAGY